MGIEQRKEERIVVSGDVMLNLRDIVISCQVENISHYGAYLKVVGPSQNHGIVIGDNVTFNISIPDYSPQELTGRILRLMNEEKNLYLAVYFLQPYTFD